MIVVDVECSGLDPFTHSLASIGAVDFNNPTNVFYEECKIYDGAEISKQAQMINGFTEAQLKDKNKPTDEQIVLNFIKWSRGCENCTLAGMNTYFDRDFLLTTCRRYTIEWPFSYRILDLHSIAYANMLQRGISVPLSCESEQCIKTSCITTDGIFNYVGMPREPMPHQGLQGATMEAEAFSRLIFGRSLLGEFANHMIPDFLNHEKRHEETEKSTTGMD